MESGVGFLLRSEMVILIIEVSFYGTYALQEIIAVYRAGFLAS